MLRELSRGLLAIGILFALSINGFAATAITPDAYYQDVLGSCRLLTAYFSAGTANFEDTWASGLKTGPVAFWATDTDNPTTQASVGVAVTYSTGTFNMFPAENSKPFYLHVLIRN